jgi:hypothetical protein
MLLDQVQGLFWKGSAKGTVFILPLYHLKVIFGKPIIFVGECFGSFGVDKV